MKSSMVSRSPVIILRSANMLQADNHVFKDTTGFEYDITLTKVDTLTNRNERIVLTVSCHLAIVFLFTFADWPNKALRV